MPLFALIAWIPLGAWFFRRFPVRIAVLINFLGGWAVLPGANYTPTHFDFPYWIMGVCLPTNYPLTKATVTGLAALLGVVLFHRQDWQGFRFRLSDLPIAVWCCVPVVSGLTHWSTLGEGIAGSVYQSIAWGVPWLLGRRYFSEYPSLLLATRAFVIAALCYVPICLLEFAAGPWVYDLVYGYQPYRWIGAARYIGFRPIGFLEDGNQLGVWMAAATLIAASLAIRRLTPKILGIRSEWVAVLLGATTLFCQSAGSILLLVFLLPLTLWKRHSLLRPMIAVLVAAIVLFALIRMAGVVSLRALVQSNPLIHSTAQWLSDIGRHSLVWRIARDESHMRLALQHPLLGSGRWNWWQNGDGRPWGLWLLVLGMYGLVGLGAYSAILFLPVLRTAWSAEKIRDTRDSGLRVTLAALILMVALDCLLNGDLILPYLLLMGGLTSLKITQDSVQGPREPQENQDWLHKIGQDRRVRMRVFTPPARPPRDR